MTDMDSTDATEVMTHPRRRFFAAPQAFDFAAERVMLDAEEAHHLRKVLRLATGDAVFVFDGEGREYLCRVTSDESDTRRRRERSTLLEIERQVQPARPESALELVLAVALLKGEKLDLVVQKATELGVMEIAFVETTRADVRAVRDPQDRARRTERFRRLALEAAKQSGRARLPAIHEPEDFASFITNTKPAANCLMFSERDGGSLKAAFDEKIIAPRRIVALVGAEGGWTNEEIAHARENSWQIVTLGGRILRAETAAMTVAALMQHLYGDLK